MERPRFHLAFPVRDLVATRAFYEGLLGASVGRTDTRWIDFDFWDHQISAHLVDDSEVVPTNEVDHQQVPARHFGVILAWAEWHALADRLRAAEVAFLIEPGIRFEGQVGEQATMFLHDPSGNALEFKSFRDMTRVFSS